MLNEQRSAMLIDDPACDVALVDGGPIEVLVVAETHSVHFVSFSQFVLLRTDDVNGSAYLWCPVLDLKEAHVDRVLVYCLGNRCSRQINGPKSQLHSACEIFNAVGVGQGQTSLPVNYDS